MVHGRWGIRNYFACGFFLARRFSLHRRAARNATSPILPVVCGHHSKLHFVVRDGLVMVSDRTLAGLIRSVLHPVQGLAMVLL